MPPSATHQHVQRMLDEIHQHYDHHITLSGLAKVVRRQSAYVGRLFRNEIGLTVREYVTRARMVFAASQVRAGVKIEAVALDVGYRSKKNFYRQFRRRFGMTPEAYRHDSDGDAPARNPIQGPRSRTTGDHRREAPRRSTFNDRASGFTGADAQDRGSSVAKQGRLEMARSLAGSRVALLVTDDRGHYVVATKAAIVLTGYSVDELRGMPAHILFPEATGATPRCCLQVVRPTRSGLATGVLQTKSAGRIPVHVTSVENLLGRRQ